MKVGTDGILLGAWAQADHPVRGLDIGCGTGLIALMLAQRFPATQIDAVEIDPQACDQANGNFRDSPWHDRLTLHCTCIRKLSTDPALQHQFSMIVSNPPWFSDSLKSQNPRRNLARHEDALRQADLIDVVRKLLSADGAFSVVLPASDGGSFLKQASGVGLHCTRRCAVHPRSDKPAKRLLMEFRRCSTELPTVDQSLVVETEQRHEYTAEFRQLTKDFYLRF